MFLDILGIEKKKVHQTQRKILPTKWWLIAKTATL
ncbi:hypothetical protein CFP56_030108 [Quercus suber]|uniref:Ribosomal protein S15 n=1 Tax=Quercus suber TaxID=58331 RepID=A0AAW0JQV5_QUESU